MGTLAPEIRRMGAEVVALANTATFSQMAFAERLGVDVPLLSDWGGEVAAEYGVRYDVWKGHAGLAKRSLFLVDESGRVAWSWSTDDALELPDLDRLMGEIARLVGRRPPGETSQ